MSIGTVLKWIFGLAGLFLIAVPFLFPTIVPSGSLIGVNSLNNGILSVVLGVVLVVLVFWLWKIARRRRMLLYGPAYRPI